MKRCFSFSGDRCNGVCVGLCPSQDLRSSGPVKPSSLHQEAAPGCGDSSQALRRDHLPFLQAERRLRHLFIQDSKSTGPLGMGQDLVDASAGHDVATEEESDKFMSHGTFRQASSSMESLLCPFSTRLRSITRLPTPITARHAFSLLAPMVAARVTPSLDATAGKLIFLRDAFHLRLLIFRSEFKPDLGLHQHGQDWPVFSHIPSLQITHLFSRQNFAP